MKPSRKKKQAEGFEEEEDDGRPVTFESLAKLTDSDIIRQVKAGLSHLAPLESEEEGSEEHPY